MNSDDWATPHCVADPLEQFYDGPTGCDPCSNPTSIIRAHRALSAGGLHLRWTHEDIKSTTGYRNPPYSGTEPWVDKAVRELHAVDRPLTEEISLVMVATSTKWWRKMCGTEPVPLARDGKIKMLTPQYNPRLLFTGRLKFIGDADNGARFDTVLAYYGHRVRAFEKEFKSITKWSTWGR